jgi:hypothetical protein
MAYFAKLGIGDIVTTVTVVVDEIATTEQAGIDFLNTLFKTNDIWKQTYIDGSQRNKFAGVGDFYNKELDSFISPSPYPSWTLNNSTLIWEAAIVKPETTTQNLTDENGNPINDIYYWNEQKLKWEL